MFSKYDKELYNKGQKRISTLRTWNIDYRGEYKICIHKIIKDIRKRIRAIRKKRQWKKNRQIWQRIKSELLKVKNTVTVIEFNGD